MIRQRGLPSTSLETVKNDAISETDFLIHQKALHIRSLISRQLNHLSGFFVFLDGAVAGKILLEGFANALNIQIVRETSYRGNRFSSTTLLNAYVNFFFSLYSIVIAGVLKGVCHKKASQANKIRVSTAC